MKKRVNMKLINILHLSTICFLMKGTTMNKDIHEAFGGGGTQLTYSDYTLLL